MKMNHFACAAALLSAVAFSACSNENEVIDKGNDASNKRISFRIAIPKGDPVTYHPMYHSIDESSIESLWLYEYDAEGKLLAKPEDIKSSLSYESTQHEYFYEKTIVDRGMRRFFLVANEKPDDSIIVGTTISTLKAILAGKTLSADTSCKTLLNDFTVGSATVQRIPMTGTAMQVGSPLISITGAPAAVSVEMERIVARIDVVNRVPNLAITDVKLAKTNSRSYLFLNGDYSAPATGNSKVSGIASFPSTHVPWFIHIPPSQHKAFYLYEGPQPAEKKDAVQLEVTGTLGKVPVFYSIPFWKDNMGVTVKRNHLYKLVLGDGTTPLQPESNVSFSIEDTPWNEVTMNEAFGIISAKHTGAGTWYVYPTGGGSLKVDNKAHSDIVFDLATKFVGHTKFTATIVDNPDWFSISLVDNRLTVTLQPQLEYGPIPTAVRVGMIEVKSNADTYTYPIRIVQSESPGVS